jgi:aminocarboxymuconate-semialdehyde decarboxylase
MNIIDIDSHSRPRTEDYAIEAEYAHLKPRTYVDARGTVRHLFNGRVVSQQSGGELEIAKHKGKGHWEAANYDGSVRYEQVKEAGIDLQYVSSGTVGQFSYIDAKIGAAFCRSSNNFIYDKFMKPYPKTFTGLPQLPLQDIPEAIKELERCTKDLGMRTFLMPTNWNGIDMADAHWWNFYERVRDLGIRGIIVHIGSFAGPWAGQERLKVLLTPRGSSPRRIVSQPFEYSTNIINLIFGGMMDVFPDLRFAFEEAGAEFAIVLKHRIEENLEQIDYLADMLAHPLGWYFDRFYFLMDDRMIENEGRLLRYGIEELGADHLFFGSDYPHPDGHLDIAAQLKALPGMPEQSKQQILGGNALTLMGE